MSAQGARAACDLPSACVTPHVVNLSPRPIVAKPHALPVEPAIRVTDCRDRRNSKYLELALAAGADAILTGDADLLVLHPWRGVKILSPVAYLGGS